MSGRCMRQQWLFDDMQAEMVQWLLSRHEVIHLCHGGAEIGCGGICPPLVCWKRFAGASPFSFKSGVDDSGVLSVPLQNVLDLMPQHEPKVIDFVAASR